MKKNILINVLLLLIVVLYAQTKTAPAVTTKYDEWEYLVISYGKAYFGVAEKTLLYQTIENGLGQEANDLQTNLDALGKFGWEVVAVVGSIGGDQEILLKRKNDVNRKKADEAYLKSISDQREKDWKDKQKTEKDKQLREQALIKDKKMLIDIDAKEQRENMLAKEKSVKEYVDSILQSIEFSNIIKKEIVFDGYSYVINIQLNLTKDYLINDNEYRKSDVDNYITGLIENISIDTDSMWIYQIDINIEGLIELNGQKISVDKKDKSWKYN